MTVMLVLSALLNSVAAVGLVVLSRDNKRLCQMLQLRCGESGCDDPAVGYDWYCPKHMGLPDTDDKGSKGASDE